MPKEFPPLLLIDKPKGISSFSVIRELRKRTGLRKFGHAGTLDPLATGLMLIGVGEGTKLLTALVGLDKEYLAEVLIGESRTTGDMEGEIVDEKEYKEDIDRETITKTLGGLLGEVELPVSGYSAIKKDGVPMYKRARAAAKKGEVLSELPLRKMKVYEAELLDHKNADVFGKKRLQLTIRFKVGSGTYIRSLAEELGQRLGYPATLYDLRRTKVGEYNISDAQKLDRFDI
jgi:tRNA pseudouridine55 synthase